MNDEDPLIGKQFANYKIQRLLGSGGMGRVYKGIDVQLLRPVAIKLIDNRDGRRGPFVERLVQEARLVASWRHENVTQIYYADEQEGYFYFVMEYVDGQDLGHLLEGYAADGELVSPKDIIMLSRSLANALDYAHKRGVVHRDIKPANLIIDREGRVFLTDFGLAGRVNVPGQPEVFGTAQYMSPEQAKDPNTVGPASDIYSFGVLLYEMLTGVVPFDDPSPKVLALKHLNQDPPRPRSVNQNLTPTIETILLRALDKDPGKRFQTAGQLYLAIADALKTAPAKTDSVPLPPMPVSPEAGQARVVSERSIREVLAERQRQEKRAEEKDNLVTRLKTLAQKRIFWVGVGVVGVALVALIVLLVVFLSSGML